MAANAVTDPSVSRLGPMLALASAVLFGASTPATKALIAHVDPWMLAGMLYLGAGLGLAVLRLALHGRLRAREGPPLAGRDWIWLAGAIMAGGIGAPLLLVTGLARMSGAAASLLLNLEAVLTALLAWLVFRENSGIRVVAGLSAIVAGAAILSSDGRLSVAELAGPLAIAGACLLWALDNNLTRAISLSDPIQIASIKGLAAGTTNIVLAVLAGATWPGLGAATAAGAVGFLGYGASLVLFVLALRHVGAARTGAYFSTAPFVGAVVAVIGLGEPVTAALLTAAALMAVGVWLHLTERHAHEHMHEPLAHAHLHRHDAHHRHRHAPDDPAGEPHIHRHAHARIKHRHPHYPDAHHRHGH